MNQENETQPVSPKPEPPEPKPSEPEPIEIEPLESPSETTREGGQPKEHKKITKES